MENTVNFYDLDVVVAGLEPVNESCLPHERGSIYDGSFANDPLLEGVIILINFDEPSVIEGDVRVETVDDE